VQRPVRLSDRSEPQPDLVLLKPRLDRYRNGHPSAADVLLLIEVSETTLRYDREIKLPLYAQHGVPEVWIVDIETKQVHCMRRPLGDRYEAIESLTSGATVEAALLPGVRIDVAALVD
jgi:Uma2 family endonuclease